MSLTCLTSSCAQGGAVLTICGSMGGDGGNAHIGKPGGEAGNVG